MADISKITLPSGSTYDIKDAWARDEIAKITGAVGAGVRFIGVSTTAITDGGNQNPTITGMTGYTKANGDLVIYGDKEFIYGADAKWHEFGDMGSLKALAFKDSASTSYTPAGSVSGTFSGAQTTSTGKFTPAGTVSKPTFTGTEGNVSVTGSVENATVSVGVGTGTANYTPDGTVSKPTFSGTQATIAVSGGTGTATYTPAGSVSQPTATVATAGATTSVTPFGSAGTLPSLTTTVADENLTLAWSAGTLPSAGTAVTVKTGDAAYTISKPTFTGTGTRRTATYTPAGSVSQPTFSGEGVQLTGSITGNITSTGKFTPTGSVSQPTFDGTEDDVTVKGTAQGSLTGLKFTGTAATITVS
jgi:hypothetical protein